MSAYKDKHREPGMYSVSWTGKKNTEAEKRVQDKERSIEL